MAQASCLYGHHPPIAAPKVTSVSISINVQILLSEYIIVVTFSRLFIFCTLCNI